MKKDDTYLRLLKFADFNKIITQLNGNYKNILTEAGADPKLADKAECLISFKLYCQLLETAAKQTKCPTFGLHWTSQMPSSFPNLGPIVFIGHFEKTPRNWFKSASKYLELHTNAVRIELLEFPDQGICKLRITSDPLVQSRRQADELMLALACRICREYISGIAHTPKITRLPHKAPEDLDMHSSLFQSPIEFNSVHCELVYPIAVLEIDLKSKFKALKPIIEQYVNYRIFKMQSTRPNNKVKVRLAISAVLGSGRCNLETIAEALGLNSKKFQRLLFEENTSFSNILEEVRESTAKNHLIASDIPIAKIAKLLDYAGSAPFSLAFRRWTGMSPTQFRKGTNRQL